MILMYSFFNSMETITSSSVDFHRIFFKPEMLLTRLGESFCTFIFLTALFKND